MTNNKGAYRSLPGVDKLLASRKLDLLLSAYGRELVTFCIRESLNHFRRRISAGYLSPHEDRIIDHIHFLVGLYSGKHLKKVINATGVIIHTNLGRSPYSREMLEETLDVLTGYSNLEFDLDEGDRGNRNDHARDVLKYLTGAEDILVVNNAAAAVMLTLRTFARNREVIVSRGELIEIGGSFRIPEIMAASDCIMVEVGTTNKTRLNDFEKAIGEKTGLLFKAHKSNYIIKGFTEDVSAEALADLGHKHGIPVLYDLGSGLLRKVGLPALSDEPDVRDALATKADLVCFSGDKLLGGPQAGIIAGKKAMIDKLKNEPMLRALRVCKTTLALLETACSYYLDNDILLTKNRMFKTLNRNREDIRNAAETLKSNLGKYGIRSDVVPSAGQTGGGSLPDADIESYAVVLDNAAFIKKNNKYAEEIYRQLLKEKTPVLGILRKGKLLFDMLTVEFEEFETLTETIVEAVNNINKKHNTISPLQ